MSRRFTFSEAFKQLGMIDNLSLNDEGDNDNDSNVEKLCPVEDDKNEEEVAVTEEGDIEAFEERDNNNTDDNDGGASSEEAANSNQSNTEGRTFDCMPRRAGILYTTHQIFNRR